MRAVAIAVALWLLTSCSITPVIELDMRLWACTKNHVEPKQTCGRFGCSDYSAMVCDEYTRLK